MNIRIDEAETVKLDKEYGVPRLAREYGTTRAWLEAAIPKMDNKDQIEPIFSQYAILKVGLYRHVVLVYIGNAAYQCIKHPSPHPMYSIKWALDVLEKPSDGTWESYKKDYNILNGRS